MTAPLVSCLCATRDRRRFLPSAIRHFLGQEWPAGARELLVFDDGEDPVRDLVPDVPGIRYERTPPARHADKLNAMAEAARGDLLHFWDDDDWRAPRALGLLVGAHLASGAPFVGSSRVLYAEVPSGRTWEFLPDPIGRPWPVAATVLFPRSEWRARPFEHDPARGTFDTLFLAGRPPEAFRFTEDWTWYVATIHAGNTSPRGRMDPPQWRRAEDGAAARVVDAETWRAWLSSTSSAGTR